MKDEGENRMADGLKSLHPSSCRLHPYFSLRSLQGGVTMQASNDLKNRLFL